MSDSRYPDDPNIPQPPTPSQSAAPQPAAPQPGAWPADASATPAFPTVPPGYPQAGTYTPGAYPPPAHPAEAGQYPAPALPRYGPSSAPLQSGQTYPPAPESYPAASGAYPTLPSMALPAQGYAPPSMPLQPGQYPSAPSMPFPGYGTSAPISQYGISAPISQYGMPTTPPVPRIEPTPAIRQGFRIAGIGGLVTLVAYFILPYATGLGVSTPAASTTRLAGAFWLVPILAAFVGVLGFFPAARDHAAGMQTPRNGGIADIAASGLGLLLLFMAMEGSLGFWVMLLGLVAGLVGGALVLRETQTAGATALSVSVKVALPSSSTTSHEADRAPTSPQSTQAPHDPTAPAAPMTPSAPSAQRPTPVRSGQAGARGTTSGVLKGLGLGLVFIVEGWNLIYKIALVILVIVGAVVFIQSHIGLNEHSSCQAFQMADANAQNQVLQQMATAHHDNEPPSVMRPWVNLYCNIKGPDAPIDGIYSGGNVGQQHAQALLPR